MHVTPQIGRYEIDREIGRGATATVYLARQVDLERPVALKELASFHAGDRLFAERFLREARIGGSLSHPNIVTVYEYFEHDGVPYIAMEYLSHGSLRAYPGRLTTAQVFGVLEALLAGLGHAEERSVVHRDLKPENLMVADDGTVKIADFGIAKALSGAVTVNLTEEGTTVGTPHYIAPEQAMGEPIGPATDLYATGAIAYELFTGRPPFAGATTPMAVLLRHVSEPAEPPTAHKPDLDPRIDAWVMRMLEKRPADRPATAGEAWEPLEDIALDLLGPRWRRDARLGGTGTPNVVPAVATSPPSLRRRRRRPVIAGAVVAVAALAVLAAVLATRSSGSGAEPAAPLPAAVTAGEARDVGVYRSVLASDQTGVWLLRRGRGTEGSTVTSVSSDGAPGTPHRIHLSLIGMGIGPDGLWMLGMKTEDSTDSMLVEVDPETGATTETVPLAGLPSCLTKPVGQCNPVVGSGSVWAPMGGRIVRQPLVGSTTGPLRFPLEGRLWDISYGNDAVWVLCGTSLVRLDPNGGKRRIYPLKESLPPGVQPLDLVATDDAIWVSAHSLTDDDPAQGALLQIDPEDGSVKRTLVMPGVGAIQVADGALWVAREGLPGAEADTVERRSLQDGSLTAQPTAVPAAAKWLAPVEDGVVALTFDKLTKQRTLIKLTSSM
jgi:tRNA A-37 threonylcarbamoyl transferase component Bud32